MRKWNIVACLLLAAPLCCVREPPEWFKHQDHSIKVPGNDDPDMVVDGPTLRALRLAADDWLPPPESKYCEDTQAAHLFRVWHRGDIIFVAVERDPAACGGQGYALDGNATYAISKDGRILRRVADGYGDGTITSPDDASVWVPVPLDANGRPYNDATATVDLRALPPEILDGGLTPEFLATVIVVWPDGGVTMPEGAVLPMGWDGGLMPSDWVYYEIARWKRLASDAGGTSRDAGVVGGAGTGGVGGQDGGRWAL